MLPTGFDRKKGAKNDNLRRKSLNEDELEAFVAQAQHRFDDVETGDVEPAPVDGPRRARSNALLPIRPTVAAQAQTLAETDQAKADRKAARARLVQKLPGVEELAMRQGLQRSKQKPNPAKVERQRAADRQGLAKQTRSLIKKVTQERDDVDRFPAHVVEDMAKKEYIAKRTELHQVATQQRFEERLAAPEKPPTRRQQRQDAEMNERIRQRDMQRDVERLQEAKRLAEEQPPK